MFRLYEKQAEARPGTSLVGCLLATVAMVAVLAALFALAGAPFIFPPQ